MYVSVLQPVEQRAGDLDLSFKPAKCVSYLVDGLKHLREGVPLSKGATRFIAEDNTKFLGEAYRCFTECN